MFEELAADAACANWAVKQLINRHTKNDNMCLKGCEDEDILALELLNREKIIGFLYSEE
ncbi:MAG: hypothetical protein KKB51_16200 [Candidatus Riflebacteria bacterium]|nr:hypothetical protein [Candidatus Riflebacteria bacterium]